MGWDWLVSQKKKKKKNDNYEFDPTMAQWLETRPILLRIRVK
jgi:hypothetical protein